MRWIATALILPVLSLAFAPAPFPKSEQSEPVWQLDLRPLAKLPPKPCWVNVIVKTDGESGGIALHVTALVADGKVTSAWSKDREGSRLRDDVLGLPAVKALRLLLLAPSVGMRGKVRGDAIELRAFQDRPIRDVGGEYRTFYDSELLPVARLARKRS